MSIAARLARLEDHQAAVSDGTAVRAYRFVLFLPTDQTSRPTMRAAAEEAGIDLSRLPRSTALARARLTEGERERAKAAAPGPVWRRERFTSKAYRDAFDGIPWCYSPEIECSSLIWPYLKMPSPRPILHRNGELIVYDGTISEMFFDGLSANPRNRLPHERLMLDASTPEEWQALAEEYRRAVAGTPRPLAEAA